MPILWNVLNEFCWLTEAGGSQVDEKQVGFISFYLEYDQKDFTAIADGNFSVSFNTNIQSFGQQMTCKQL